MSSNKKLLTDIAMLVASQVFLWYGVKWVIAQMDPMRKQKDESQSKSREILRRLKIENQELDEYETIIASEIVHPDDITTQFKDIGGLDDIVESLRETVIYPLTMPEMFDSNHLFAAPKG